MLPYTKRFCKDVTPLSSYAMNDIVNSVSKFAVTTEENGFFLILQGKHEVFTIPFKELNDIIPENLPYSPELIDDMWHDAKNCIGLRSSYANLNLWKASPSFRPYRRMKFVGIGSSVSVDHGGTTVAKSCLHEVVLKFHGSHEASILFEGRVPIGGTASFDFGKLFKSEIMEYLKLSSNPLGIKSKMHYHDAKRIFELISR